MKNITILLADDEIDFSSLLCDSLLKKGFSVLVANNGQDAINIYLENKVDIIISDVRMPVIDGLELLTKIRLLNQNIKFILMTGFSDILETKTAFDLGADEFLAKPFKLDELFEKINLLLGLEGEIEEVRDDSQFKGVPIEDFIEGKKIPYPTFLRLGQHRYVKVANEGGDILDDQINKFKGRGIDYLYLKNEDYEKYFKLAKKILTTLATKRVDVSEANRLALLKMSNILITDNLFSKTLDNEIYEDTVILYQQNFKAIVSDDEWLKLVQSLSDCSNKLFAHSLCVAFFSIMLAKKMQWFSEKNHLYLCLGGVLHDIGKKLLPPEYIDKSLFNLSAQEKREIDQHPLLGAQMMHQMKSVPETVVQIILQHHENCMGTGYPNALSKHMIHPLAKVVGLCNEFMNMVSQEKDDNIDIRFKNALGILLNFKLSYFEPQYLKSFIQIFSFGPQLAEEMNIFNNSKT